MANSKIDEVDDYSEQLSEVLDQVPSWFNRWGITIIILILAAFILVAAIIRYPDAIQAQITVTTAEPPVTVLAKADGRLSNIFVSDNDTVEMNQPLAVIENPAAYHDVASVDSMLRDFQLALTIIPGKVMKLGDIQDEYLSFKEALNNYRLQIGLNPQIKEATAIRNQIFENQKLLQNQQLQQSLFEDELKLLTKDFERNKKLYETDVISSKDFEQDQVELIRHQRALETIKVSVLHTKISIQELQRSLDMLVLDNDEVSSKLKSTALNRLEALRNAIAQWQQSYLIRTPIRGEVTFFKFWTLNQNVTKGEDIFTIVPMNSNAIFGKVLMPIQNSGKVKIGQSVNIRLNNYPYPEFGFIKGNVKNISLVPKNNTYAIEVQLADGLKTSYQKQLPFKQEMQGVAEIITEEMSVLNRLFYQIRKMLDH